MPRKKTAAPAPPQPRPTREQKREQYVMYITNERDRARDALREWRDKLSAIGTRPDSLGVPEGTLVLAEFAWRGQGAIEVAATYKVADNICAALEKGATLEALAREVTRDALAKARWGSRSTSIVDDVAARAEGAALAKEAETLTAWCHSRTKEDDDLHTTVAAVLWGKDLAKVADLGSDESRTVITEIIEAVTRAVK